MKRINVQAVCKEQLKRFAISDSTKKMLKRQTAIFFKKLQQALKKQNIPAQAFVGGSFAKGTMIAKEVYEIDIFVRFQRGKKEQDISGLIAKALKSFTRFRIIHGSRDYFQVKEGKNLIFEVIPVLEHKKSEKVKNSTDLSYAHVAYVKKKLQKNKKLSQEIIVGKAFAAAQECYGAESYIQGFSGYVLELLILHYKGFQKLLKAIAGLKEKEQLIIDSEKLYKNKQEIFMNMNRAKLKAPLVLVDPTFKERNAAAALSHATLVKFKKAAQVFLKKPSSRFFEKRAINLEQLKKEARKKKYEFIIIESRTDRQAGDIAGTKLSKFFNFLSKEIVKQFDIKRKGMIYDNTQSAQYYFSIQKKKELLVRGPPVTMKNAVKYFKERHADVFEKKGVLYAREIQRETLKEFLEMWRLEHAKQMREMGIVGMKIEK